jgi:hypothetical protein
MSASVDESPPPVAKGAEEVARSPAPDGVRGHAVVVVAVASVVVMACSVWVAWTIAESPAGEDQAGRWGAPNADVQAIEMSLLPRSDAAVDRRAAAADASNEPRRDAREAKRRLSSYGHSDRSRGTVHIPLERAKQLYLERERARASSAPRRAK